MAPQLWEKLPKAGPKGQKQPAASHQALTGVVTSTESAGRGLRGLSGPSPTVYLSGLLLEPSIWMKDHTASLLPPPPQLPHQASKSADLHTTPGPLDAASLRALLLPGHPWAGFRPASPCPTHPSPLPCPEVRASSCSPLSTEFHLIKGCPECPSTASTAIVVLAVLLCTRSCAKEALYIR